MYHHLLTVYYQDHHRRTFVFFAGDGERARALTRFWRKAHAVVIWRTYDLPMSDQEIAL